MFFLPEIKQRPTKSRWRYLCSPKPPSPSLKPASFFYLAHTTQFLIKFPQGEKRREKLRRTSDRQSKLADLADHRVGRLRKHSIVEGRRCSRDEYEKTRGNDGGTTPLQAAKRSAPPCLQLEANTPSANPGSQPSFFPPATRR